MKRNGRNDLLVFGDDEIGVPIRVELKKGECPKIKSTKRRVPLMHRAVDALSRREYTRADLRKKLSSTLQEDEAPEGLELVLDQLESLKYLSTERFAKNRARYRAMSLGNARIRQELWEHGVDKEIVNEAIEMIEEPEEQRALRVWQRRFRELPQDFKERERQIRYLVYRGFSMQSISKVLKGLVDAE